MREFIIYFMVVISCAFAIHLGGTFINGTITQEQYNECADNIKKCANDMNDGEEKVIGKVHLYKNGQSMKATYDGRKGEVKAYYIDEEWLVESNYRVTKNPIIPTILFIALYCFCIIKLKAYRSAKVYENEDKIREKSAKKSEIRSLSEILILLILVTLILYLTAVLLKFNPTIGCAFLITIIDFPIYYKSLAIKKESGNYVETKIKNAIKTVVTNFVYVSAIIWGIIILAEMLSGILKLLVSVLPVLVIVILIATFAQNAPTEEEQLIEKLDEINRKL